MIRLLFFFLSRNHFVSFFLYPFLPMFLFSSVSSSLCLFLPKFLFPLSLRSSVPSFLFLFLPLSLSFFHRLLFSCCICLNAWWQFVLYQRNNRVSCTQKQIRSPNTALWHVFYVNSIRIALECKRMLLNICIQTNTDAGRGKILKQHGKIPTELMYIAQCISLWGYM